MSHLAPGGSGKLPPLAIFTDFDGTLVELAPTPDAIAVPEDLPAELAEAAHLLDGALAIVSGRAIADLERHLPEQGIAFAGSHGAERRRPDGSEAALDAGAGRAAEALAARLAPFVSAHPGLLLESKPGAVALHYRLAPELEADAVAAMQAAAAEAEGFHLLHGKMVIEARPSDVSKASAIRAFAGEAPFAGRVPVFIGDDTTDEDGFAAAQALGGLGIKVGDGPTVAALRVPDIATARALIRQLAERSAESAGDNAR